MSCVKNGRRHLLALACAVPVLAACGYQLGSGSGGAPTAGYKEVALQGLNRHDPLRDGLKRHLREQGVRVVSPQAAAVRIVITKSRVKERLAVVGDYAKTREKLLILTVEFDLIDRRGKHILRNRTLRAEDAYLYDSIDPTRNTSERNRLLGFLYRRLAEQLAARLGAAYKGVKDA